MMSRLIGILGEKQAINFLKRQGYTILSQNFSSRFGEIDIIARDRNCVVFVEVKKRKNTSFGSGAEYVDIIKQKKIIKTALYYIQRYNIDGDMRFDVIEINNNCINHIKNAFCL